jgi:hypothetical protein
MGLVLLAPISNSSLAIAVDAMAFSLNNDMLWASVSCIVTLNQVRIERTRTPKSQENQQVALVGS